MLNIADIIQPRENGEPTVEDRKFLARCKTECEIAKHLAGLLGQLVWGKLRFVMETNTEEDSERLPEVVHQIESCREILADIAADRFVSFKKLPLLLECFGIHRVAGELNDGSEEGFAGLENLGQVALTDMVAPMADLQCPIIKPMSNPQQLYRLNMDSGEFEPVDDSTVRSELNAKFRLQQARLEGKNKLAQKFSVLEVRGDTVRPIKVDENGIANYADVE